MNTNTLQGRLNFDSRTRGDVRIAALDANGVVCAETTIDPQGGWQLSCPAPIVSAIAQLTRSGIAAGVATADATARPHLLPRHPCRIEFTSIPEGVRLWVDPVSLDGFPDQYLPALRSHPNGTIDLHLGDYACGPGELILHLQAGRYRITGGRVALRSAIDPRDAGLRVAQVENLHSGQLLPLIDGEFLLTVDGHTVDGPALRVSFAYTTEQTP
jgi:hypothetical protein